MNDAPDRLLEELERSGLSSQIALVREDARRVLGRSADGAFDFIFLDSERPEYPGRLDAASELAQPVRVSGARVARHPMQGGVMSQVQPGILEPVPPLARYLAFSLGEAGEARECLRALREIADGRQTVVGFGESLARALDAQVPGLRTPPGIAGRGFAVPSTPFALWCWLRGTDRGELLHRSRHIGSALSPAFRPEHTLDAFKHEDGRDLTGYEDGTENPKGEDAIAATVVRGQGEGWDGSSFVAVQQWQHDFERFEAMRSADQDDAIGRRRSDNEELKDAPASAHVKRTAQESFTPEAFLLRRSMPWVEGRNAGLHFVAFGRSFDAFEAQLNRMVGAEDGIADALFAFTRPVSSAYFWCPPLRENRLCLRALGV